MLPASHYTRDNRKAEVMKQSRLGGNAASIVLPVATVAAAFAIFIADNQTSNDVAVPVLYAVVVLMAARFLDARRHAGSSWLSGSDGGELRTFAVDWSAGRGTQHTDQYRHDSMSPRSF
jgi:hypothetical protein